MDPTTDPTSSTRNPAANAPEGTAGDRTAVYLALAGLLAAIAISWITVLPGGFHLDDVPNITKSKPLKAFVERKAAVYKYLWESPAAYRPLAYWTLAMNAKFQNLDLPAPKRWKALSAKPFVMTNAAIHMVSSVCVFLLAGAFLRLHAPGWSEKLRDWTALFAAALWALNPVQTAAVSYPVQRMAVLAALFSFITLWAWLKWRETGRGLFAPLAVLAFAAGMASKENTATILLLIGLYEWLYPRKDRLGGAHKAVLALLAAMPVALLYLYLKSSAVHLPSMEQLPNRDFNSLERLLTEGRVLWHYASLWALPLPGRLHLEYTLEVSRNLLQPWTTLAAWAGWIAMGAWAVKVRREKPGLALLLLGFLALNAAESSILNLALAFQHRLYLPSLVLAVAAAAGAASLVRQGRIKGTALAGAALVVLAGCSVATSLRNREWSSSTKLLYADILRTPAEGRSYYNLAKKIKKNDDQNLKLWLLEKAVELDYGLNACMETGFVRSRGNPELTAKADALFAKCAAEYGATPDLYVNWGGLYRFAGQEAKAREMYETGLKLDHENAKLLASMGTSWFRDGNLDEAERWLKEALLAKPKFGSAHMTMAMVHYVRGDKEKGDASVKLAYGAGLRVPPLFVRQGAQKMFNSANRPEGSEPPEADSDTEDGDEAAPEESGTGARPAQDE